MGNSLLSAALSYAQRGWLVIPVWPRSKFAWFAGWPRLATTDEQQIRRWWDEHPDANVGVLLGSASGIVAIDVDSEDGEAVLAEMSGGDMPATVEKITPGGRRLIYAIPEGLEYEPLGLSLKDCNGDEMLRLQGKDEQMVMPPSVHPGKPERSIPAGGTYRWAPNRSPDEIELAVMPPWLVAAMSPAATP